jgi:uncharacterized protein
MQKIQFPQEVVVWYILPAIRKKIAQGLICSGMSQKEVAKLMKTSEATISHYKKEKRAKENIFGNEIDKDINKSVKKILSNNQSLFSEIIRLNSLSKVKHITCELYKKKCTIINKDRPCISCSSYDGKLCLGK